MKIFPKVLFAFFSLFLFGCASMFATPTDVPVVNTEVPIDFYTTVVSLTFDDGYEDNYQIRSILKENNLNATFYVVSDFIGSEGYMTEDQLRNLYEDGNEIGGHTYSHAGLVEMSPEDLKWEICQNRVDLLKRGFSVTSFAYPFGSYNNNVIEVVRACGYNNARTVAGGPEFAQTTDVYRLRAMPYIVDDTHFLKMTYYVMDAQESGSGNWAIFTFHHVCAACGEYMTVDLKAFSKFAKWLGEQQNNGLRVSTVGDVIGGNVKPSISP